MTPPPALANEPPEGTIGIYIHIPYCLKKCPYCDFNSYAIHSREKGDVPERRYVDALCRELTTLTGTFPWRNRAAHSVFIGGGTPSLFAPESIAQILRSVREAVTLPPGAEVTMEANPGTIHEPLAAQRLALFREAGINRLSMGAQSFSPEKLLRLGRLHSPDDTRSAVQNLRDAGFENFNLDLMYGIGEESLSEWQRDLEAAVELSPAHISAYTLMIEPGTEFARLDARGELQKPADEAVCEMFQLTRNLLRDAAYEPYELSNFARRGRPCRHNLGYWLGEDYLALGAGAYGFHLDCFHPLRGVRTTNIPGPEDYMRRVEETGSGEQRREALSLQMLETEFLLLRFRLEQGLVAEEYLRRFGIAFEERYARPLARLAKQELVRCSSGAFHLSEAALPIANEVLAELVSDESVRELVPHESP